MQEKKEITATAAWQAFARSGQISDYLSYCAKAQGRQEDLPNAIQNPGPDFKGTEYR